MGMESEIRLNKFGLKFIKRDDQSTAGGLETTKKKKKNLLFFTFCISNGTCDFL